MKGFLIPAAAVLFGIAISQALQAGGMAPLWAKLAGLGGVAVVIIADWQRKARA